MNKEDLIKENREKLKAGICYKCEEKFYCGGFETIENSKKSYAGEEEAKLCCCDCEQTKRDIKEFGENK